MAAVEYFLAPQFEWGQTAKTSDEGVVTKKFTCSLPVLPAAGIAAADTLLFGQLPKGCRILEVISKPTVASDNAATCSLGVHPNTWFTKTGYVQGTSTFDNTATGYDADGVQAAGRALDAVTVIATEGAQVGFVLDTALFSDSGDADFTHLYLGLLIAGATYDPPGEYEVVITYTQDNN
jgi:hypothetical protein